MVQRLFSLLLLVCVLGRLEAQVPVPSPAFSMQDQFRLAGQSTSIEGWTSMVGQALQALPPGELQFWQAQAKQELSAWLEKESARLLPRPDRAGLLEALQKGLDEQLGQLGVAHSNSVDWSPSQSWQAGQSDIAVRFTDEWLAAAMARCAHVQDGILKEVVVARLEEYAASVRAEAERQARAMEATLLTSQAMLEEQSGQEEGWSGSSASIQNVADREVAAVLSELEPGLREAAVVLQAALPLGAASPEVATQWRDGFNRAFEQGLQAWQEAEQELLSRRLAWEQESAEAWLAGQREWLDAGEEFQRRRESWFSDMQALIDQTRQQWEAEETALVEDVEEMQVRISTQAQQNLETVRVQMAALGTMHDQALAMSQAGEASLEWYDAELLRLNGVEDATLAGASEALALQAAHGPLEAFDSWVIAHWGEACFLQNVSEDESSTQLEVVLPDPEGDNEFANAYRNHAAQWQTEHDRLDTLHETYLETATEAQIELEEMTQKRQELVKLLEENSASITAAREGLAGLADWLAGQEEENGFAAVEIARLEREEARLLLAVETARRLCDWASKNGSWTGADVAAELAASAQATEVARQSLEDGLASLEEATAALNETQEQLYAALQTQTQKTEALHQAQQHLEDVRQMQASGSIDLLEAWEADLTNRIREMAAAPVTEGADAELSPLEAAFEAMLEGMLAQDSLQHEREAAITALVQGGAESGVSQADLEAALADLEVFIDAGVLPEAGASWESWHAGLLAAGKGLTDPLAVNQLGDLWRRYAGMGTAERASANGKRCAIACTWWAQQVKSDLERQCLTRTAGIALLNATEPAPDFSPAVEKASLYRRQGQSFVAGLREAAVLEREALAYLLWQTAPTSTPPPRSANAQLLCSLVGASTKALLNQALSDIDAVLEGLNSLDEGLGQAGDTEVIQAAMESAPAEVRQWLKYGGHFAGIDGDPALQLCGAANRELSEAQAAVKAFETCAHLAPGFAQSHATQKAARIRSLFGMDAAGISIASLPFAIEEILSLLAQANAAGVEPLVGKLAATVWAAQAAVSSREEIEVLLKQEEDLLEETKAANARLSSIVNIDDALLPHDGLSIESATDLCQTLSADPQTNELSALRGARLVLAAWQSRPDLDLPEVMAMVVPTWLRAAVAGVLEWEPPLGLPVWMACFDGNPLTQATRIAPQDGTQRALVAAFLVSGDLDFDQAAGKSALLQRALKYQAEELSNLFADRLLQQENRRQALRSMQDSLIPETCPRSLQIVGEGGSLTLDLGGMAAIWLKRSIAGLYAGETQAASGSSVQHAAFFEMWENLLSLCAKRAEVSADIALAKTDLQSFLSNSLLQAEEACALAQTEMENALSEVSNGAQNHEQAGRVWEMRQKASAAEHEAYRVAWGRYAAARELSDLVSAGLAALPDPPQAMLEERQQELSALQSALALVRAAGADRQAGSDSLLDAACDDWLNAIRQELVLLAAGESMGSDIDRQVQKVELARTAYAKAIEVFVADASLLSMDSGADANLSRFSGLTAAELEKHTDDAYFASDGAFFADLDAWLTLLAASDDAGPLLQRWSLAWWQEREQEGETSFGDLQSDNALYRELLERSSVDETHIMQQYAKAALEAAQTDAGYAMFRFLAANDLLGFDPLGGMAEPDLLAKAGDEARGVARGMASERYNSAIGLTALASASLVLAGIFWPMAWIYIAAAAAYGLGAAEQKSQGDALTSLADNAPDHGQTADALRSEWKAAIPGFVAVRNDWQKETSALAALLGGELPKDSHVLVDEMAGRGLALDDSMRGWLEALPEDKRRSAFVALHALAAKAREQAVLAVGRGNARQEQLTASSEVDYRGWLELLETGEPTSESGVMLAERLFGGGRDTLRIARKRWESIRTIATPRSVAAQGRLWGLLQVTLEGYAGEVLLQRAAVAATALEEGVADHQRRREAWENRMNALLALGDESFESSRLELERSAREWLLAAAREYQRGAALFDEAGSKLAGRKDDWLDNASRVAGTCLSTEALERFREQTGSILSRSRSDVPQEVVLQPGNAKKTLLSLLQASPAANLFAAATSISDPMGYMLVHASDSLVVDASGTLEELAHVQREQSALLARRLQEAELTSMRDVLRLGEENLDKILAGANKKTAASIETMLGRFGFRLSGTRYVRTGIVGQTIANGVEVNQQVVDAYRYFMRPVFASRVDMRSSSLAGLDRDAVSRRMAQVLREFESYRIRIFGTATSGDGDVQESDGLFAAHVGKVPNQAASQAGSGELGRIFARVAVFEQSLAAGMAQMEGGVLGMKLWDDDADNDGRSDGLFQAPDVRTVLSLTAAALSWGQSAWVAAAINLGDDVLGGIYEGGLGYRSWQDVGWNLTLASAGSLAGAGIGQAAGALGTTLNSQSNAFSAGLVAGLQGVALQQTNALLAGLEWQADGMLGWNGDSWAAAAGSLTGWAAAASSATAAFVGTSMAGMNLHSANGLALHEGLTDVNAIRTFNQLSGALAGSAVEYLIVQETSLNLFNLGIVGGPGNGLVELRLGGEGAPLSFGGGGADVSIGNLLQAGQGIVAAGDVMRWRQGGEEDNAVLSTANVLAWSGIAENLARAKSIVQGDTRIVFAELEQALGLYDENTEDTLFLHHAFVSRDLSMNLKAAAVAAHEGAHLDGILDEAAAHQKGGQTYLALLNAFQDQAQADPAFLASLLEGMLAAEEQGGGSSSKHFWILTRNGGLRFDGRASLFDESGKLLLDAKKFGLSERQVEGGLMAILGLDKRNADDVQLVRSLMVRSGLKHTGLSEDGSDWMWLSGENSNGGQFFGMPSINTSNMGVEISAAAVLHSFQTAGKSKASYAKLIKNIWGSEDQLRQAYGGNLQRVALHGILLQAQGTSLENEVRALTGKAKYYIQEFMQAKHAGMVRTTENVLEFHRTRMTREIAASAVYAPKMKEILDKPPMPTTTYCNVYLDDVLKTRYDEDVHWQVFQGKALASANDLYTRFESNPNMVELSPHDGYTFEKIQELADRGYLIIAAGSTTEGSGHVALVGHSGLELYTVPQEITNSRGNLTQPPQNRTMQAGDELNLQMAGSYNGNTIFRYAFGENYRLAFTGEKYLGGYENKSGYTFKMRFYMVRRRF